MVRRILGILLLGLLATTMAKSLEYWPADLDGKVYRYRSAYGGAEVSLTFSIRETSMHVGWSNPSCYGSSSYVMSDASVGLMGWGYYCHGSFDPTIIGFVPPIDIVRTGMADGERWLVVGTYFSVMVEVSTEVVYIPLGKFDVLKVAIYGSAYLPYQTYWLHRDLGPVKLDNMELISIGGEVATEPKTWSSVKSLYR